MVEVELREWGNSVGVIIPAETLRELKLKGPTRTAGQGSSISLCEIGTLKK